MLDNLFFSFHPITVLLDSSWFLISSYSRLLNVQIPLGGANSIVGRAFVVHELEDDLGKGKFSKFSRVKMHSVEDIWKKGWLLFDVLPGTLFYGWVECPVIPPRGNLMLSDHGIGESTIQMKNWNIFGAVISMCRGWLSEKEKSLFLKL